MQTVRDKSSIVAQDLSCVEMAYFYYRYSVRFLGLDQRLLNNRKLLTCDRPHITITTYNFKATSIAMLFARQQIPILILDIEYTQGKVRRTDE